MHDSAKLCQWSSAWDKEKNDECRTMNDELPGDAASAGTAPSLHHASFILHHLPLFSYAMAGVADGDCAGRRPALGAGRGAATDGPPLRPRGAGHRMPSDDRLYRDGYVTYGNVAQVAGDCRPDHRGERLSLGRPRRCRPRRRRRSSGAAGTSSTADCWRSLTTPGRRSSSRGRPSMWRTAVTGGLSRWAG